MNNFQELSSIEEIEHFIQDNLLAFLYITQPNCSVCHGLEPQITSILNKYPQIQARKINAGTVTEIAGRCSVFTAPVLLLLIDGKEYIREARIVQTDLFEEKLSRIYKNMVD